MTRLKTYKTVRGSLWPKCQKPRPSDWELLKRVRQDVTRLESSSDRELRQATERLQNQVADGADVLSADILVPSFALTNEAIRRVLCMSYYDVQLLAGFVLATGAIAEMQTGEGKTIVAALPAIVHALTGRGVHVATVNSYLAKRDYELLKPAMEVLGFSVGLVGDRDSAQSKKTAYACDITYATGYQLGFDYLHDQIVLQQRGSLELGQAFRNRLRDIHTTGPPVMQREHAFAIIDEIDSVLIDEATTPLILSGAPTNASAPEAFGVACEMAGRLVEKQDFIMDPQTTRIDLTEQGAEKIYAEQAVLLQSGLARPWVTYIAQALRARHILQRNVDYIAKDDKVMIVDQNTGRIFAERNWRDGLHQAVEAKEGLPITEEKCTIARISRQRYFRMYDRMCGMTGTASGNESEFNSFYGLPVVAIPLRKPSRRMYLPSRYFGTMDEKYAALAKDIAERHRLGQPVLVGTRTIKNSLLVAEHLAAVGLKYQILNGVQDDDEAALIARAGQFRAVTIATNMAGRGTDIKVPKKALDVGGLHVVATDHHKSMRIDRQLIGRSARQGDPGSCQFLVSAEDELIRRFSPRLEKQMVETADSTGEIVHDFSGPIRRLQQRCEHREYVQRCELLKQESWLENVLATVAKED